MSRQPGYYLALSTSLLAFVVILLGAWTRLVDAGLGCPDWPACYGQWTIPTSPEELARAEALYPDSPVDPARAAAEMIHRYAAGLLGLLVLGLVGMMFKFGHLQGYPRIPIVLLAALVIAQATAGALTVTLKLWPQIVVAHLLGGFATLGLLAIITCRLANWTFPPIVIPQRLAWAKILLITGLILLVIQIALGGWTSSNYAALACPDLPTCQGKWWPNADFAEGFSLDQQIGPNYLGGQLYHEARTAIHLAHRIGAVVVGVYLLVTVILLLRWRLPVLSGLAVLGILAVQWLLGLLNILWQLPLSVSTAHNGVAALLLVAILILVTQAFSFRQGSTR